MKYQRRWIDFAYGINFIMLERDGVCVSKGPRGEAESKITALRRAIGIREQLIYDLFSDPASYYDVA